LRAAISNNNGMYVAETFYFSPNSLSMTSGSSFYIFYGYAGATVSLRLEMHNSSGAYQLRAAVLNDSGTWTNTSWFTISNARHVEEFDYQTASTAGRTTAASHCGSMRCSGRCSVR
jgi:hypothetical protein